MSVTLISALLIQVIALAALRVRLGKGWLARPTTILVLAATAYHGLSEILLSIASVRQWDAYRSDISQAFIDKACLVISAGLLALVLGYLATRPERASFEGRQSVGNISVIRAIDWRLYALACAPLAIITYEGRGYFTPVAGAAATPKGLASTFLIILVVLSAFGFLGRHGMRWFIEVLIAQSLLLAAVGERTPIVVATVALLVLLLRVGMRPSRKQFTITFVIAIVTILGITGYRAAYGRTLYYSDSGLVARLEALGTGLYAVSHASAPGDANPGLITQLAVRFDGNSFAGGVLQDMSSGQPELGVTPAAESLLLAVPTSLWSSKLSHETVLNPALTSINQFGLAQINYLPTMAGLYMAYIGTSGTVVFLALIGAMCGLGERWLFRRHTTVRLIILASSVQAALNYEGGLPTMIVALRAGVMLAAIAKIIEIVARRRHHHESPYYREPLYSSGARR
jgi:hypothetical protein